MKLNTTKFFTITVIILLIITTIFIIYAFQQKNDFSKSKFYGEKTFDFCGENLKKYQGCEKFCEELTGINCKTVNSKSQRLNKGTCYYIDPQVEMGDPCSYCTVKCEPL